MKKFYTSYEGFALKTIAYNSIRISSFLYFYDWINHDPRRYAKPEKLLYAAIPGGLIAGLLTNPFELVFTRMQAEDMYHKNYRRNYASFWDGLIKSGQEGVWLRGGVCNGLRIAMLLGTMTGLHDWCKENSYYFLGPNPFNRTFGLLLSTFLGTAASMPFDAI